MKFNTAPIHTLRITSSLGGNRLAATAAGLAGLWFDAQRHAPNITGWIDAPTHPVLRHAATQIHEYLRGQRTHFDLPLDLSHGTAFQQLVWQALLRIPHGASTSYAALGAAIGKPAAARAVGAAVGRNPISVIVPCHRVLGSHGALTGYAGGLERKRRLLALEGCACV
jgi:methylated-DNA-[protein]-cysteine S-methyltransferase